MTAAWAGLASQTAEQAGADSAAGSATRLSGFVPETASETTEPREDAAACVEAALAAVATVVAALEDVAVPLAVTVPAAVNVTAAVPGALAAAQATTATAG